MFSIMHLFEFERKYLKQTKYFTIWLLKELGKKNLKLKVCACS